MMNTPRIRTDLEATPAEEGGIKYFDVSDPKSGSRLRLYDFEWLIAERLDGRRPLDEVASWARERLGIQPSGDDLATYADKLRELGLLEPEAADARTLPTEPRAMGVAATLMAEVPVLPAVNGAAKRESINPPQSLPPRIEAPVVAPAVKAEPRVVTPAVLAPAAIAPPVEPAAERPAKRSSGTSLFALLLVLVLVGGVAAYIQLTGDAPVKVATVAATSRAQAQLYDGSATLEKSSGQTLSFGEAGTVSEVVAVGTEATAGMPLATLDSFAEVEQQLADLKERETRFASQLEAATAKGDPAAIRTAQARVDEKKRQISEREARLTKLRLLAPGPGTVSAVLVSAGSTVTPGAPAVRLTGAGARATFALTPGDAAELKVGQSVSVQPADGPALLTAQVAKVEGGQVTVDLPANAEGKPGDQVRLVKADGPSLIAVPATAVVHGPEGDLVYVLGDGVVHARAVTVADHSGAEALIQSGLQVGDQVVASNADSLHDGQKATPQ